MTSGPASSVSSVPSIIGIDVGGANVKFATAAGEAWSEPFELWKTPHDLTAFLRSQFARRSHPVLGRDTRIALTMTGELADCFATKAEGVVSILESCVAACPELPWSVYLTCGEFVSVDDAKARPLEAAASNWHALALWTAQQFSAAQGLLIDVGSTTTDLIRFGNGLVLASGRTDPERLAHRELVYLGAERTPVPMLVDHLVHRGRSYGIARELFATSLDVHLCLGLIDERPTDLATADGRPATRGSARSRLARLICADLLEVTMDDAVVMARQVFEREQELLSDAFHKVIDGVPPLDVVVLSGQADYLVLPWLRQTIPASTKIGSWRDRWPASISRVGPAFAIAQLLRASLETPKNAK